MVSRKVKKSVSITLAFQIAGKGSSAAGLEAFEEFLTNLPVGCGIAIVILQHLDPTSVGVMPELPQRNTSLQAIDATENLLVEVNRVYVIPPNKSMSILRGYLHLVEPGESRGFRLPVDVFFRSLADDQRERSIDIILSGMGSNGSLGLKVIKEQNGLVLVQDPKTYKFSGVPGSAIDAVNADIVVRRIDFPGLLVHPVNRIPEESNIQKSKMNIQTFADQSILQKYAHGSVLINPEEDILYITGKTGKYPEPAAKEEMQSLNEELQTENVALQTRVNEFTDANGDMKNLLKSTDIATLFLDRELNIRRFTDHMTKLIKLRQVT